MKQSLFNLIISIILGLVAAMSLLLATKFDYTFSLSEIILTGSIVTICALLLLCSTSREKIRHICCDLDWAEETTRFYQNIPQLYRQSFWIIFGIANVAFIFHTINFMWGNRDWSAIRYAVNPSESLAEGRFSAYWLQEILFSGKILPVINNLWAFAGMSLAAILLGVYWKLPKTRAAYITAGLLLTITPYTLSWLYFAKNTLGNLWLPAIVITALLLSEKKTDYINKAYAYNLSAILCFIIALGTYAPVINFIGVAILAKVLLTVFFEDMTLKDACLQMRQTAANLATALMIYAFIIVILKDTDQIAESYNTAISPLFVMIAKIPALLLSMFAQFTVPLPFFGTTYRILSVILAIMALFTIIFKSTNAKTAIYALILIPFILIASRLTFLVSVQSAENPLYLARIDFYSLPLIYVLSFAILAKSGGEYLKRVTYAMATLIIFMGMVRIAYALKVWKFGWDAETKLAERIITRLEKMPDFNIEKQYKILQIGEKSLRTKYYVKKSAEYFSGDLLGWAYYPEGNVKDAYNFYYQTDFVSDDTTLDTVQNIPEIRNYLLNQAQAWPANESILINGEYIILVLDEKALARVQQELLR